MSRLLPVWLCLALGSAAVDAAEVPLHRWAILAAPEVREAGISDLLTAKLSEREFELVERDQLEAVLKELKLSQLLGSQTSERLSLGARLRADVLVLLSVVEIEQSRLLKVVIGECRQGARLRAEFVPWSSAGKVAAPDELAQLCEKIAVETRTQFSGGVRELVAITPLLSKNLTREFDHLQTGYAALLGRAISQAPGVAVVEIDEARAIRQELAVTGDAIKDRLVPLFVEGEFAMSGRSPDVRVRITLRLTDGQKERRKLEREEMTLPQSVDWLTNDVPLEIAARPIGSEKTPRFSREQQFEQLARRAETFSRAAAFEESTALREAALLLNEDDVEQHWWLIADSRRLLNELAVQVYERKQAIYLKSRNQYRGVWDANVALDDKERQPLFEQARQRAQRMDDAFRWLLARRAISRREATWIAPDIAQRWFNVSGLARQEERAEFFNTADQAMSAMLAAYWQLDPLLRPNEAHPAFEHMTLPGGGVAGGECRQHDRLCQVANYYWLSDWEFTVRGTPSQRLGGWQQFVKQHVSRRWPSDHLVMSLFAVRKLPPDADDARQKFREFCSELEQTNEPLFRLYARTGRLALRMCEPRKSWDSAMDAEAKSLQQAWDEYAKSDPLFVDAIFPLSLHVPVIVKEIEQVVRTGGSKTYALSRNTLIGVDPDPRIAFEPLPDLPTPWSRWQRIHDRLDVMWTVNSVWTMAESNKPRLLHETQARTDMILDVCCDGRLIWVFTQESGLLAFTLDGRRIGTLFPEDAAPDAHRATNEPALPAFGITAAQRQAAVSTGGRVRYVGATGLHPIAPGRCLVLGTYRPKQRLWIAAVSTEANGDEQPRLRVQVVHEATTDAQRAPVGDDDNAAETFTPIWMTEMPAPTPPARRLLLLGRPQFLSQVRTGRRPLAVDLESFEVSVFPGRFGISEQTGEPRHFGSGRMIYARGHSLNLLQPPADPLALDWTRNELVPFFPPQDQREWWRIPSRTFVAVGDHWENPGPLWRRVFPADERLEQLTPEPIAPRHRFRHYSLSAHYGLVAWNNGDIAYRVHFNRDARQPRELAWLYPFVPPLDRERHHRAVQSIRERGGFVDAVWQGLPNNWTLQPDGWATKVFLSDAWRGGDAGLNALADLHQLRELKIVQAPITNQGLEAIGRIASLRTLSLEETAATDDGLPQLSGLKELTNLRLENVIGGSAFTDAGLDLIHQLPKLEKLTVSGPGFTDAMIDNVSQKFAVRPMLFRELRLLDTNASTKKLDELRAQRRSLNLSLQPEFISLSP